MSDNVQLIAEWDWEKNDELGLSPYVLTIGKNVKAWWKCSRGHQYQASIGNRNYGYGCPYCSGRYAIKGENDLLTVHPHLAKEWNCEKNNGLTPEDVLPNSDKKVWWKCSHGHEWQTQIKVRARGNGCPFCSGRNAIKGVNDLLTVNPSLAEEWNYEKNDGLTPMDVLPNCEKKAWWKCSHGHEWEARIDNRSRGSGCPYCAGVLTIQGENDLQTINPDLAKEWNYEKNNGLTPMDVLPSSDKKAWWKCSKGHEWKTQIKNRTKGTGCPYCAGRKVLIGFNDLATTNPVLAAEWNYEKNEDLTPKDVTKGSGKKVWWRCSEGHEWQASIANRNYENDCPICQNKKILVGYNDLTTINPTLASEWNYERNSSLTPENFAKSSGKKVWWKCKKGHEWKATIASRNIGIGCPVCNSERHTSFPEFALVYYLKKYGMDVIHSYKDLGYELDVYIQSRKIAIEYDGSYWHKDKTKKELKKNARCKADGIILYRIRQGLPSLNDSSIDYLVQENQKNLEIILTEVLSIIIETDVDVDLSRDSIEIENLREYTEKSNSILFSQPEIAKEWNYEKNVNLKPEHVTANSTKNVWWKCQEGHEWKAAIVSRTHGNKCPYCSNRQVMQNYNDLQTDNPFLAKEWNYEKNDGLVPADVKANSDKKVWWKCAKGHEWQATIGSRNSRGHRCPYCSGRYAIKGVNDLQTVNPTLANEWLYEKNNGLTPMDVLPNSDKIVWWICSRGHKWETMVKNRTRGSGCPYCSGRKVLIGFNDLKTTNPDLALEWNYERNGNITSEDLTENSHKVVWWKCQEGHEWQARVDQRNNSKNRKCPICEKAYKKTR